MTDAPDTTHASVLDSQLSIPALLADIRSIGQLSLSRIAELTGASLVAVTRWESGEAEPTPSQANRLVSLRVTLRSGKSTRALLPVGTNGFQAKRLDRQASLFDAPAIPASLTSAPLAPILTRLKNDRVFDKRGMRAVVSQLEAHQSPALTIEEPAEWAVSAGKNTYTYDAHTYHTKVPPQGIAELIAHYLPQRGLVLDLFAGSGMTGVAASVLGHDCVLNELSPAACFIASQFTTSIHAGAFAFTIGVILEELRALRRQLYSTSCRECGKPTELLYTVWSYSVLCGSCNSEFVLWDHCRRYGRRVRDHKILSEFPCPACSALLKKSRLRRTRATPVLVGYKCCSRGNQETTHTPSPQDLALIDDIESHAPLAEGFYPTTPLRDGVNLRQPIGHGLDRVDRFYTKRNLSALSHLWKVIHRIDDDTTAPLAAFVFTSLYQRVSKISEFRFWGGSGNTARFNVPFIFNEANVFRTFERKARSIQDHLETTARHYSGNVTVVQSSATSLAYLPDESIDLIFTDPPFGSNINYSEMNFLWEAWLGEFTDRRDEAIVNRVDGKDLPEYERLILESLREAYRVLRPGHWLLLVFNNSSAVVWRAIRDALAQSGLHVCRIDAFDKEHGTFKQFVSQNAAGYDLVLHCRKPSGAPHSCSSSALTDPAETVRSFLDQRRQDLPTTSFLHVGRKEEIDFRKLYSEWLASNLFGSSSPIDLHEFRSLVSRWIDEQSQRMS